MSDKRIDLILQEATDSQGHARLDPEDCARILAAEKALREREARLIKLLRTLYNEPGVLRGALPRTDVYNYLAEYDAAQEKGK